MIENDWFIPRILTECFASVVRFSNLTIIRVQVHYQALDLEIGSILVRG